MKPDFASAREHVERARKILTIADSDAQRMCHVLDLTIEAILLAEYRRPPSPPKSNNVVQAVFLPKPPHRR
jgi:hypothetical protein